MLLIDDDGDYSDHRNSNYRLWRRETIVERMKEENWEIMDRSEGGEWSFLLDHERGNEMKVKLEREWSNS